MWATHTQWFLGCRGVILPSLHACMKLAHSAHIFNFSICWLIHLCALFLTLSIARIRWELCVKLHRWPASTLNQQWTGGRMDGRSNGWQWTGDNTSTQCNTLYTTICPNKSHYKLHNILPYFHLLPGYLSVASELKRFEFIRKCAPGPYFHSDAVFRPIHFDSVFFSWINLSNYRVERAMLFNLFVGIQCQCQCVWFKSD